MRKSQLKKYGFRRVEHAGEVRLAYKTGNSIVVAMPKSCEGKKYEQYINGEGAILLIPERKR